jgi:N-methylhydantoinase A
LKRLSEPSPVGDGSAHAFFVGLDVGGTFTDAVVYDVARRTSFAVKVPSNRSAPDQAVLAALAKSRVAPASVRRIVHGTTVATNALLERRGARVAFLASEGFRDVIELGRTTRLTPGSLYDPYFRRRQPVIQRRDRHEVEERIAADGAVDTPLDEVAVDALGRQLASEGIEAIAIGFLNAYRNPLHEERARAILRRHLPFVTISTDVLNEVREYERFFATALNAYLMPGMARYVGSLQHAIDQAYPLAGFYTVASHGGLLTAPAVTDAPVRTILSGPAAGLAATLRLARAIETPNVITCDMGGTSTDVALVHGYALPLRRETILDGDVIRLPQLDIHTVGAGGGSIASLDAGGGLFVGPESAGARPGPACYGHGGARSTITDANVVLGRLGASQELGSSLRIDADAAWQVVSSLAEGSGLSPESLAEAIVDLGVAKMAAAVHEISVARGFDPADFVLLCYGGAGPLHACLVAEELGIPRVIAPPNPGAFSAFGALCSVLTKDRSLTLLATFEEASLAAAADFFASARTLLTDAFVEEGIAVDRLTCEHQLDLRYAGQAHEMTVVVEEGCGVKEAIQRFEVHFEREFGRLDRDRDLVLVNARLIARIPVDAPDWVAPPDGNGRPSGRRKVIAGGESIDCAVWQRESLSSESVLVGPTIIEEMSATTYLPRGWTATRGSIGELDLRWSRFVEPTPGAAKPSALPAAIGGVPPC